MRRFSKYFSTFCLLAGLISTPIDVNAARADEPADGAAASKPSGIGRFLPWADKLSDAVEQGANAASSDAFRAALEEKRQGKSANSEKEEAKIEDNGENPFEAGLESTSESNAEPKAEPTPAAEPKAEPTPAAEPKAEPTPAAEPKAEPTPAPEPKAEPTPAPEPKAEPAPAAPASSGSYVPGSVQFPTPSSFTNYSDAEMARLYETTKTDEGLDRINRDYIAQRIHKEEPEGTVAQVYEIIDTDPKMLEMRVKMLEEQHKELAKMEQEKSSDQPSRRTVRNTRKLVRGIIKLIVFILGGGAATAGAISSRKKKKQ